MRDVARNVGIAKSSHLPHNRVYKGRDGQAISFLSSTTSYLRARWNHVQLGPDSLPPQLFVNPDGFFDIRITGSGVDIMYDFTLRLDTQNIEDGANIADPLFSIRPMLSTYFFDRVEVQPDGGSTQDTQYADQTTIALWHLLTTEQKAVVGPSVIMNASGSNGINRGVYADTATYDEDAIRLRAGETRSYFIPHYSMLTQAKLFLPDKTQNPRLRYYCTQSPICTDSGALTSPNTFRVVGANGIVSGILLDDCIRKEMRKHYMAAPALSRVLVNERQILDLKTITAGSQLNDLSLTVFNGEYSMFWLYLIRAEAVKENLYASNRTTASVPNSWDPDARWWIPVARASFTDSDGNPVWFNFVPGKFIKNVASAQNFPGTYVYEEKNLYPFVFATDAPRTLATGANTGGMALDSNFQLQIVPGDFNPTNGSGGATTAVTLRVNALRYAILTRSVEGKFTVSKL